MWAGFFPAASDQARRHEADARVASDVAMERHYRTMWLDTERRAMVRTIREMDREDDRAGKESCLQALERLAPEVRAGAIGQTKASYFDQGLLTTGMIRSPLRAVEARLQNRV
jgi:hypothetical protein